MYCFIKQTSNTTNDIYLKNADTYSSTQYLKYIFTALLFKKLYLCLKYETCF